jgi:hypothetical protein
VGALGTAVTCPEQTVVAMPPCLSYEAASSMPTVFITAQLAMGAVTGVQPGERVLVHAAAGGVGLAALQVLRVLGAVPVATAGSPSKRSLLRSLGVQAVVGSRDTQFVGPLACLGGVDVVLNSLTSPGMVGGSLSVLRRGGRFVEIGKRDIWAPAAAAAERPDVAYSLLAVDFLPDEGVQNALQRVAAGVAAGQLAPLPTVSYSLGAAAAALRQMSQARHVGKVVVSTAAATSYSSASQPQLSFRQELTGGAAVVTGGLGALGVLVSRWLAQQGISQLILLSRTGKLSVQQHQQLQDLIQLIPSVEVTARQADVSMSADASDVFGPSRDSRPVLLVMHAGGVLDDRLIANQTLESGRKVLAPKLATLQGCMQSMQQQPAAAQVFFSSVASLLGSPGQANYAAANAGLDAAAGAAQLSGIPAVSVQWGAWAGGGMAAADAQTAARVERMGMSLISPAAGLAALEGVLAATSLGASAGNAAVVAAIPFKWQRMLQRLGQPTPAFFEQFAAERAAAQPTAGAVPGRRRTRRVVQQQQPAQQPRLLEQVQSTIVLILGREVSWVCSCTDLYMNSTAASKPVC